MLDLNELRQQRAAFIARLRQKHDATVENGANEEEERQMQDMEKDILKLEDVIAREEKLQASEGDLARSLDGRSSGNGHLLDYSRGDEGRTRDSTPIEQRGLNYDERMTDYLVREKGLKPINDCTFGDFLRAKVTGKPRTPGERRALSESVSDAAGGTFVPDFLASTFIDKMRSAMNTMKFGARTIPLTSDNLSFARTITDPTPAWRAEAGPVSESDPVFERLTLLPRSLAVFCKVSQELLDDAPNAGAALAAAFTGACAVEVERVALAGSGTPPEPKGIRNTTNVNETSQGTNGLALANWDNVVDVYTKILTANEPVVSGMIMAPRTFKGILLFKEATTNAPLQPPPVVRDIPIGVSTSVSIAETQGSSSVASTLYMGNWSRLWFGIRNEVRIEILRELYRANLQVGFLVWLRMDIALEHPQSFGRLIGLL
jgi:HK97 family phage major capsid protein